MIHVCRKCKIEWEQISRGRPSHYCPACRFTAAEELKQKRSGTRARKAAKLNRSARREADLTTDRDYFTRIRDSLRDS